VVLLDRGLLLTRAPLNPGLHTHPGKWENPGNFNSCASGWEMPLKFVYWESLDNIELLPFDYCSFASLQLQNSEFCGASFV
jgi:hypothetical protein